MTAFSLRYQDIKIGAGAEAEPDKIYKVHYTGWLAGDGRKFDSSYDHPGPPIVGKDDKMVRDTNGKVIHGDPQPITFIQGTGRAIPGFDQGFAGMRVGGKRRLFIPWQMAYGALGRPGPDAAHQGIPPRGRSDLRCGTRGCHRCAKAAESSRRERNARNSRRQHAASGNPSSAQSRSSNPCGACGSGNACKSGCPSYAGTARNSRATKVERELTGRRSGHACGQLRRGCDQLACVSFLRTGAERHSFAGFDQPSALHDRDAGA